MLLLAKATIVHIIIFMRPSKVVEHIPEISDHLIPVSIDQFEQENLKNLRIESFPMMISDSGRKASIDIINGQPLAESTLVNDFEQLRQLDRSRGVLMLESDVDALTGMALKSSLAALLRFGERDMSQLKGGRRRKLGRAVNNLTRMATGMSISRVYLSGGLFLSHNPEEYVRQNEEHYQHLLPFVNRGLRKAIEQHLRA
jgi:hypothetical protein